MKSATATAGGSWSSERACGADASQTEASRMDILPHELVRHLKHFFPECINRP